LTERKEGTLARLLAAPVSTRSIIGAKAMYGYTLGAGSMAILIVASSLLMGASWGDPVGVALLVAAGVFAAMGIQSVVTTLAKTDEQAAGYGSLVGVTLGLLGGTFFPLSQAPPFLQNVSYATPHAWLMRGFGDLSGGVGTVADVLPSLAALLAIGAVTGAVALMRSRRLVVVR
jgi:ABC-2 type transport system permease protein